MKNLNLCQGFTESDPIRRLLIVSHNTDKARYVRSLFERTCLDRGFKIVDENPDLVISIGGDGTMLRTIREYKHLNVPFVGINAGTLGFLPNFSPDKESLSFLLDMFEVGKYKIIIRPLLDISMTDEDDKIYENFAYNELIVKYANMKMMNIDIYIDDVLFNRYTGDGLAVSTPLGTTGYSIWAGAAVINPDLPCYQLTPINPNNSSINNPLLYPIVIPDYQRLRFEIINREKSYVVASCDGNAFENRLFKSLSVGISKEQIKIIESCDYDYWAALKSKILDKNMQKRID